MPTCAVSSPCPTVANEGSARLRAESAIASAANPHRGSVPFHVPFNCPASGRSPRRTNFQNPVNYVPSGRDGLGIRALPKSNPAPLKRISTFKIKSDGGTVLIPTAPTTIPTPPGVHHSPTAVERLRFIPHPTAATWRAHGALRRDARHGSVTPFDRPPSASARVRSVEPTQDQSGRFCSARAAPFLRNAFPP